MSDDDVFVKQSENKVAEESSIPLSSLQKLVKDFHGNYSSPDNKNKDSKIRVSKESRDLLIKLGSAFIHKVTSSANKTCEQTSKKLINHTHILDSLQELAFTKPYMDKCVNSAEDAVQQAQKRSKRRHSSKLKNQGKSIEELEKEQEDIFEKARLAMLEEEQANNREMIDAQENANAQALLNEISDGLANNNKKSTRLNEIFTNQDADNDDYD